MLIIIQMTQERVRNGSPIPILPAYNAKRTIIEKKNLLVIIALKGAISYKIVRLIITDRIVVKNVK